MRLFTEISSDESSSVPNAFGLWPSPWNYPEGGKRQGTLPLAIQETIRLLPTVSSMAPAIVERSNGDLYLTLGGSGGARIFGAIAQTILNVDRGMDVSSAVEEPRVHDQLFPSLVSVESDFGEKILKGLKEKGHNITGEFSSCDGLRCLQGINVRVA